MGTIMERIKTWFPKLLRNNPLVESQEEEEALQPNLFYSMEKTLREHFDYLKNTRCVFWQFNERKPSPASPPTHAEF